MLNVGYAFISAYLKGAEAKIITSDHISRMSQASSVPDVLEIIRETDIGSYLQEVPTETFDDIDEHLWKYFGECLERPKWFKPVPSAVLQILKEHIVKYDVLNIKAALQGISTGKEARRIPVGVIHNSGLLDELFTAEDVDGVIGLLNECKLGDYASVLEEYKTDEGVKPSLLTEARLEEMYYKNLINMARNTKDGSIFTKVFGTIVDMINLQVILRAIIDGIGVEAAESTIAEGYIISSEVARELLSLKLDDIPGRLENTQYHDVAEEVVSSYDRTNSIIVVEEIIDKHKFRLSKEMLSPRVLSPLVILWYLILKEVEVRNLRLILKVMFDNIPLEEIKNYLVLPS